jgi:hypothetical protein
VIFEEVNIREKWQGSLFLPKLLSMKYLIFTLLIFWLMPAFTQPAQEDLTAFLKSYVATHYPDHPFDRLLFVSLKTQRMYHFEGWQLQRDYIISGAAKGAGNLSGSNQTPTGLHTVAACYGDGLPLGAILKARRYTGKVANIYTDATDLEEDDVTTRILWLKGEEPGINRGKNAKGQKVDSYQRYIYIHGTPEEGLLGKPASHGCIRMKNAEVADLYEKVSVGTSVLILEE